MRNSIAIFAITPVLAALVLYPSYGCGIIGPSCLGRQQTGAVTTVSGEVGPGATVSHQVPYGTNGSQNDGHVRWSGEAIQGGPRIQVYATRVGCIEFNAADTSGVGACAVLSRAGWFGGNIASTVIITHGRGNPEVLGSPAEYKLWIVGDPQQPATYTIDITWFYGPDC